MKRRDLIGRLLLTVAVVGTPGFQVTADWSYGHITNPEWPAHAKYHLIVYHLTLIFFSLGALGICWGKLRIQPFSALVVALAVVAFWLPYYLAALFPMASPYATADLAQHRIPVQFLVGAALVAIALLGFTLTRPRYRV